MNGFENDADMKIVGDERPAPPDTAAKWQQQKACGNMDRAHRLGAVLAQQLMNIEEPDAARLLQKTDAGSVRGGRCAAGVGAG